MSILSLNKDWLESPHISDQLPLDNAARVKISRSLWLRLTHFKQKRELDQKVQQEVSAFFKERYGFEDQKTFERMWKKIVGKTWTVSNELTIGALRAIDAKFRKELIYHGPGVPSPKYKTDTAVQELVQALLHGGRLSHKMLEQQTAKAIFIKHDPELMKQFLEELQQELHCLAENPPKGEKEEFVWRAFLGNVLALLPYTYPADGTTLVLPILKDGVCRKVEYTVEEIPLTLTDMATPMILLGLTPKKGQKAPSILSFMGTTFPAGSGFATTLLADFTPGHSVGEAIYRRNQKAISSWLENRHDVHAVGMSLGGALALNTLRHHHDKLACIDAYVPSGLYPSAWKDGIGTTCKVNIYCQPGDVVSQMGAWPTGDNVSLYTVFPHQEGVSENALSSHARAFTGCKRITVIKEDPKKQNGSFRRRFLTRLHQFLGPFIIFIPVYCTLLFYRLAAAVNRVSSGCFKSVIAP